jgi:hypothetical protein
MDPPRTAYAVTNMPIHGTIELNALPSAQPSG